MSDRTFEKECFRHAIEILTTYAMDLDEFKASGKTTFSNSLRTIAAVTEEMLIASYEEGGFERVATGFKNYSLFFASICYAAHAQLGDDTLESHLKRLQAYAWDIEVNG